MDTATRTQVSNSRGMANGEAVAQRDARGQRQGVDDRCQQQPGGPRPLNTEYESARSCTGQRSRLVEATQMSISGCVPMRVVEYD